MRELFPRRICLRVTAKSHVGMVLGDQAYERGAWANRISTCTHRVAPVYGPCRSWSNVCAIAHRASPFNRHVWS